MVIELINTGTELLRGNVLNTHQQWISQQLAQFDRELARQVTIPDEGPAIESAVRDSLSRADLVLTTGGLGPTSDDITRDLIAKLLDRKLSTHLPTLKTIENFFAARKRPMPASTRVQALVPDGALVLANAHGTAPGLAISVDPNPFRTKASWLVMLPGPPRELRPMFLDAVQPLIEKEFPAEAPFACQILRTTGIGESMVEEKIAPALSPLVAEGLEIGYCARIGEVDVRLIARGPQAARVVADATSIVREKLSEAIFAHGDEALEQVVVRLLRESKQTLVTAESCTGGYIAHRITNVPGASEIFPAGLVTYSNEAKQLLLGVSPATLKTHGAVSTAVACEMAEGARTRHNADFALAVTGIAGPGGGSEAKPVGTVHLALASAGGTAHLQATNRYDRETFKFVTSQQALDLLRRQLQR